MEGTMLAARKASVARRRAIRLPGGAVVRLAGAIPSAVVIRGVRYEVMLDAQNEAIETGAVEAGAGAVVGAGGAGGG